MNSMDILLDWNLKIKLYAVCLTITLVNGRNVGTYFQRTFGNEAGDITCAREAVGRSYQAIMIDDTSNICTNLDREWGLSYDAGSTYFEKKRVLEIYDDPLVLGDSEQDTNVIKLPIIFNTGAYVDMNITFTTEDFTYGFIRLLDTIDNAYHIYQGPGETVMINMELKPQPNPHIYFKTWAGWWGNHGSAAYPFKVQTTHKITFKALETKLQILVNGTDIKQIPNYIPTKDAKMLEFTNSGMLLNNIEFVGV